MAIYSCSVSNIKRSDGRSSIAKAAYNSRSRLEDIRTGNIYDYSLKKDLGFSEIITPDNAPSWMSDRQELWAENELVNKRRDARVAKEILVALPRELNREQQVNLVQSFVTNNLTPLGVVADVNAHELEPSNEPDWNPHAHILITTNHIDGESFGGKITELNKKEFVINLRKAWAEETNLALEAGGTKARVDHRSNKARGINRSPQIHLGHKVWAMKQKGIATDRGDRHREIEERNQEIDKITAEVKEVIESNKVITRQPRTLPELTQILPRISHDSPKPTQVYPQISRDFPQLTKNHNDVVKDSISENNKPWWSKAKDFVFGSKKDNQDFRKPIARTENTQKTTRKFFEPRKEKPRLTSKLKSKYPDVPQTEEQKQALAKSLVEQIDNHHEINKHLRRKIGKLAVLANKNQISVFSLMFSGGGKEQQEKLILKRKDTGWEITKYTLSNNHRKRLLEVLKVVSDKQHQKLENLEQESPDRIFKQYMSLDENQESPKESKGKGFQR